VKYNFVTAFNETLLQQSTISLLNEFKDNWEKEINFHCYYYDIDLSNYSLPKASNIHYHNLLELSEYSAFLKNYSRHDGTEDNTIEYSEVLNVVQHIPKIMAVTECGFNSVDWVIWFDPS